MPLNSNYDKKRSVECKLAVLPLNSALLYVFQGRAESAEAAFTEAGVAD